MKATDTESRIEDEQKAHKAKQAERHNTRMAERKRLSILEGETEEKEKTDDDQSLSEFMSIMGEVISHSEPATLSPDNLDNIDKEENQGGNPTQQNDKEGDGDKDDQTADGKVTSDSHPESDKEDGEDETGEEDEDEDDENYIELSSDEGSQVPSDSEDPFTAKLDANKPAEAKPPAKRRSPRVVKPTPEQPPSNSTAKPAKRTAKAPAKKVPASKPKAVENPIRKRKTEDAGIEQPQRNQIPRHQNMTTSLFNMKEAFYMGRDVLLKDMDGSARLFYQQAHRPGFSAGWQSLIEDEALDTIRDGLLQNTKLVGYTPAQCMAWPELPDGELTLKEMAEDLKTIYFINRRTQSTYDFDLKLRRFQFKFSWLNGALEHTSIAAFRDIILGFYNKYDNIDSDRQDDICKIFYKKLPPGNKFTENFMDLTKVAAKERKKDNIREMLARLVICLQASRETVTDADKMGGLSYTFTTKLTPEEDPDTQLSTSASTGPSASYKTIPKRRPDNEGISRTTDVCHTCGMTTHNRYNCPLFMNPHCNNSHVTWNASSIGQDFKRIGHSHFKPDIYVNNEKTHLTNYPGASTYRLRHLFW